MKENKKEERHCSAEQQNSDVVGRAPKLCFHLVKIKCRNAMKAQATVVAKNLMTLGRPPHLFQFVAASQRVGTEVSVKSS